MPYPRETMPLALGDVGEMQRARAVGVHGEVVSKEPAARTSGFGLRGSGSDVQERTALHQEDIEIAVVVVVDHGRARRDDLGVIELALHAVHVPELQSAFFGAIDEPVRRSPAVTS